MISSRVFLRSAEAKGIRKEKLFLVSGEKLVQEILSTATPQSLSYRYCSCRQRCLAQAHGVNTIVLSPALVS
jgi:hypothetical protein